MNDKPVVTVDDLVTKAKACLFSDNKASFDPVTDIILGAILSAIVQHYVEDCLKWVDTDRLHNPTLLDRAAVAVRVKVEARRYRRANPQLRWPDGIESKVKQSLYGLASRLTMADLSKMKAARGIG